MNRLKIAEAIKERIPILLKLQEDEWEQTKQLRRDFTKDYTLGKITTLTLDQYVIGKGADNRSFCYRLEREMDILGRIIGATALKFGVYYGRIRNDPTRRYRFAKHWGSNHQNAFIAVKRAIIDLLIAARRKDFQAITENRLSPMLKGKLLFVYYPEQYAPIYSREHLHHFVAELDIDGTFKTEAEMQRALMYYRQSLPKLRNLSPVLYMRFLYEVCGHPKKTIWGSATKLKTPLLRSAIVGAQFIAQMPFAPVRPKTQKARHGKSDYTAQQKQWQRIGDRGESIVFAIERQRLLQAGKKKLSRSVRHVSQHDDSLGFDILSFDEDGTERPIEVKATSAIDSRTGFYITANELEKSKNLPNYHLYVVFSAMSDSPRILPLKKPNLKARSFDLQPLIYWVIPRQNSGLKKT